MTTLADQRKEYEHGVLEVGDLGADPLQALAAWIDEALQKGALEPTAMTLCTVASDGMPSARIVLCKGVDDAGLRFFTNYDSHKGRELAANANAAVTFFWPALERQARVQGVAERLPREDSERYFHSRPRLSQIAALASPQSRPLPSRAALDAEVARLNAAYPDEVPLPDFWGGYLLRPRVLEFWQGRRSRLHDRVVFRRDALDGAFTAGRLAP